MPSSEEYWKMKKNFGVFVNFKSEEASLVTEAISSSSQVGLTSPYLASQRKY